MVPNILEIDGSYGEGGGQILRTAVALAAYTGTPCVIKDIRKGRPNPGLRAQHLAGLQALAQMCHAEVEGLHLGSQKVIFKPGEIREGDLTIDVGTAGAIGLVLQTLLLPGIKSQPSIHLTVAGGTDVPWAPTAGYVKEVLFPVLARMGYSGTIAIHERGYFPAGGGRVSVQLKQPSLSPLELLERGEVVMIRGLSHASTVLQQRGVAERQREAAIEKLKTCPFSYDITVHYENTTSPGSGVDLWVLTENSILGANTLGARGRRAEEVGEQAAFIVLKQIDSRAALDEWMGDQILPFLAVTGGQSAVSVPRITNHLRTNLWVITQFLSVTYRIAEEKERAIVEINPLS